MKFLKSLLTVTLLLILVVSCKKDPKEPMPTIADIAKTYKAEALNLTIDGKASGEGSEVVLENSESGLTINLKNIIEGESEFLITNTKFDVATKAYYSKIAGERSDYLLGKKVVVAGEVENGILKMNIATTAIEGELVEGTSLVDRIFKSEMIVNVAGEVSPASDQFVYFEKAKAMSPTGIKIKIKNFAFGETTFGDIALDTLPVIKGGDDLFIIAKDQKLILKDIGEVLVDVKGSIIKNELKLNLSIKVGEMIVLVTFVGEERVSEAVISIKSENIVDDVLFMGGKLYAFTVKDDITNDKLTFTPTVKLPIGAKLNFVKITVGGKSSEIDVETPIDFSTTTKVEYSITAEGATSAIVYVLSMRKITFAETFKFSFDEWTEVLSGSWKYQTLEPINLLASSNGGAVMFVNIFGYKGGYPVLETEDAKSGNAAKLVSLDTRGMFMVPALTSGSVFLGAFELDMANNLNSTKFGVPFTKKPLRFKGNYKYAAGSIFIEGGKEVTGKKDKFSIAAVMYEVSSYAQFLTGNDINTSEKVVARAVVPNDKEAATYTAFDIEFKWVEGKQYDKTKKYKLAFICSSSVDGDKYNGGVNSTLFIDEFEITAE